MADRRRMRDLARRLRKEETVPERRLWWRLRVLRVLGAHVRRQVPIGRYIVDFAWLGGQIVIEVDGDRHGWLPQQDADRDDGLKGEGCLVLRFWNEDVRRNSDGVMEVIHKQVSHRLHVVGR